MIRLFAFYVFVCSFFGALLILWPLWFLAGNWVIGIAGAIAAAFTRQLSKFPPFASRD